MNKLYIFFLLFLLYSCANEVAPSGGEKDVSAPELKWSKPNSGSINFDSKKIELKFNEFIKFKSSSEYIFISPPLKEKPKYILNGKKIIIQFKENLLKNTTYSINFNEAIEDFNEGNKINNLNYVFSTGSFIDSLTISGNVFDAFNNKTIEDVLVLLYPETEDSVLYKRPQYFTKTDKSGNFTLKNLKNGKYKIACLEDKNLNYIFDQNNERISFSDGIIDLNEDIIVSPFYLFNNLDNNSILESDLISQNHLLIKFNKPLNTLKLDISDYNTDDIFYYSKNKRDFHYWFIDKDSLSLLTFDIDGALDTLKLDLRSDNKEEIVFSLNASSLLLGEKHSIELSSTLPIKSVNTEKITLFSSDEYEIPFSYYLENNNLSLIIESNSNEDTIYFNAENGAISSFNKKTNVVVKELFNEFIPNKSSLILNIPFIEGGFIVQLFNKDLLLIGEKIVSRETSISFNNVQAGKYTVRIFEDNNKNGLWDSGLFHVKQFPEKTLFYSSEIELKPNWDKELDVKF